MTKPWDLHEATIKKLYAEKTLSQVRKIMIEKYNFKASTRAYRGRLDKWGVRKYNCRRRSDCGSISAGSPEGSISGSDTASPTLSQSNIERSHDPAPYPTGRHTRVTQSGMSSMQGRSYSNMEMDTHRTDSEQYAMNLNLTKGMGAKFTSYSRNRTLASPTHGIQYGWNIPQTQSTSPPTMFGHPDIVGTSGPLYAYPPVSPTSNTYPSVPYEPDQAAHDRRQSYPQRQYSTMHNAQNYPPMRDYGHGHSTAGMRSFNSIRERIDEPNSRG
ncbi:hypothetical protein EV127DRAFT_483941 [Xylaria flabelliformis]|nr:hypothetical protein EV127DRAFT_483941 [Xylaria flabelliformis]